MGGKNYNNHADDTNNKELLTGNEKELSELTSKINEVGKQFGMEINIKKTKAMVVSMKPNSPKINISIDGLQIERERTYVPRYRCSPNLCSLVPMFPGTDVPRFFLFNSGNSHKPFAN